MKFIYILSAILLFVCCKKNTQDKNTILTFSPYSDFSYTNKETVFININTISTDPLQKITIRLVVDDLDKDSIISEHSVNTLEVLNLQDSLYLDVDWEDSLDMKLILSAIDESNTTTNIRNGLYLQQADTLKETVFEGKIYSY